MKRSLLLLLVLGAAKSFGGETAVEIFTDKGDTFVRAGSEAGLQKGTVITVLGDLIATTTERRRIGTAVVMETWPTLSRISLDDTAKAASAAKKFGAVPGPVTKGAAVPPPPPPPSPTPGAGKVDAPPAAGTLVGHATFKGAGPWMLLQLYNDGTVRWSDCVLELQANRFYNLRELKAQDHEAIALSNFVLRGPEFQGDASWVKVKCAQGASTFKFDN